MHRDSITVRSIGQCMAEWVRGMTVGTLCPALLESSSAVCRYNIVE